MRLFIAAPISEEVRRGVAALIEELRAAGADYKWTGPENLHVTLAFLGETPETELPNIEKALRAAVAGQKPFDMVFSGLGAFSSLKNPRIIWIGLSAGADSLIKLARALIQSGIKPKEEKREFSPHLTLGRMRSLKNLAGLKTELGKGFQGREWRCGVDRLILYRSRPSPQGSKYEELFEASLK